MQAFEPIILLFNNIFGVFAHVGSSAVSAMSHSMGRF